MYRSDKTSDIVIESDKVSEFIPNLLATKYVKPWINKSIGCGILNSASLLYRGPADYKFTDSSSSFQMNLSLQDACLELSSSNIEEIALMGEIDNYAYIYGTTLPIRTGTKWRGYPNRRLEINF